MRLFSDFYTFWEKANFWYMNHDSIIIDGCLYFIECEILREDNRSRKCPIVTLFYKHSFGIKIDWLMCTFSGYSEDIARKCYIDLTGVHSCYGCNYDYFFCKIKYIEGYLSEIDLMFMRIMNIDLYIIMCIMFMRIVMSSVRFRGSLWCFTDTEEFWHYKKY